MLPFQLEIFDSMDILNDVNYPHTLFRFPLRTVHKSSELTDVIYDREKV